MQDNLDPREYRNPSAPKSGDVPARPITDREVPLTGQQTPSAIHSWLDGELSESAVRQSDASRDVDFWLRLDREVQARRQMTTPLHLHERIMEALPTATPAVTEPWYSRSFSLTPAVAIVAAAGAIAIGVAVGATVLHAR
jgi:hypothetical protein